MKLMTVIFFLLLLDVLGVAQQPTANEVEQVWSSEEAYWRYAQSHNLQNYMALWSDDFVGWPRTADHPVHKTDIGLSFQSGTLSRLTAYELHRESVEMHGPVVVVFYRVTMRLSNADRSESTVNGRITHTWMKKGDVWQIVAGMSADDSTPTVAK